MAKKRRSRKTNSQRTRRRTRSISSNRRLRSAFDQLLDNYNSGFIDARRLAPLYEPYDLPKKAEQRPEKQNRAVSAPSVSPKKVETFQPTVLTDDKKIKTCVRRKQRKEVMHALGHAGKGGQKTPVYNSDRNIKC